MSGSEPKHLRADQAGTESHEAQSALVGGGRSQPYLSASKFADANEGSRDKRHPWVWALAWVAGFAGAIAILILIVR
jgi:hypothetical protein